MEHQREQADEAKSPIRAIAQEVRRLRTARGWSAAQLAAEMTRAGIKWERMVVTKVETGRRQALSIEELFTLAEVLEVTPVDLVVPPELDDDAPYAVTPALAVPAGRVRAWAAGLGLLTEPQTMADFFEAVRWMPADRSAALSRKWWTPERDNETTRRSRE